MRSRAFQIGQAAQCAQGAGIEPMGVLDDEQRRPVSCGLLHREHPDHREEFTVGAEIGFIAELAQRRFEQRRRVEPGAVDDRAFLIVVARIDKMLDKRGFAG